MNRAANSLFAVLFAITTGAACGFAGLCGAGCQSNVPGPTYKEMVKELDKEIPPDPSFKAKTTVCPICGRVATLKSVTTYCEEYSDGTHEVRLWREDGSLHEVREEFDNGRPY